MQMLRSDWLNRQRNPLATSVGCLEIVHKMETVD